MKKEGCYALYKGDRFIDLGTLRELSQRLGISTATLWFYTSKVYKQRCKQKKSDNYTLIIKVEEIDENDINTSY